MKTKTEYDWLVEEMEDEDVIEVNDFETLIEAKDFANGLTDYGIALVRYVYCTIDGDQLERGYAYLENGKLPTHFDDGNKVPKRFVENSPEQPPR
jgi:hypothetical protein